MIVVIGEWSTGSLYYMYYMYFKIAPMIHVYNECSFSE